MQAVRAKMVVHALTKRGHFQDGKAVTSQIDVEAAPVTGKGGDENKSYSKWTPSGSLKLTITNPDCFEFFKEGAEFYVDITPAEVQ